MLLRQTLKFAFRCSKTSGQWKSTTLEILIYGNTIVRLNLSKTHESIVSIG